MRLRADIEAEIASKRRERELYVSAQGVGKIHGEIDALLEEWRQSSNTGDGDESSMSTTASTTSPMPGAANTHPT